MVVKYLVVIYLIIISFGGCSSTSSEPANRVDRDLLLSQHIVLGLMDPQTRALDQSVSGLNQNIKQACSGGQQIFVADLQEQWHQAMSQFHYLAVFNHGPLSQDNQAVAELIYSPPGELNKENLIGKEIKKAAKKPLKYKIRNEKPIILGLDSMEYVLFDRFSGLETLTAGQTECAYLSYLAKDIDSRLQLVVDEWQTKTLGNYLSPQTQTDLKGYNAKLAKGLIVYTDKVLKDRSLAGPLGIEVTDSIKCTAGENCHTLYFEHPFAGTAQESIAVRLRALEDIFSGKNISGDVQNFGFNDYLQELEIPLKSINLKMNQNSLSQRWLQLPSGEDYQALFASYGKTNDPNNIIYQGYFEVRTFNTWLKNEFIVDLSSKLPGSVQGDND